VRVDCVTTPEVTSSAGAVEFVRTHESEAIFEVRVAVSLGLFGVGVPIPTVCHPAEDSLFPMEVGNSPRIVVLIVAAAPAVAVVEGPGASARSREWHLPDVLNCHLGGVLSRRSLESTEGDRSVPAFLMPFRGRGGWKNGT